MGSLLGYLEYEVLVGLIHVDKKLRVSLAAQWLRIRLHWQGKRVRSLVREDPTCHGATKPVCHNY